MKKLLPVCVALFVISLQQFAAAQSRYFDEVFTGVSVTSNQVYGKNISIFPVIDTVDLHCDIYQPTGDTATSRPLVIYLHTGSFLPILINGTPSGDMRDSATVEMCKQFARRGYVAVSMDYRVGWNPVATGATGQDIRTGTLLQAVYRSLQDAKVCVRYFKETVSAMGNPFHIDTSRIALGGQGSGGYVVLAYATLDKPAEIMLLKFLSATTDLNYGFVQGQPYVNQSILGDFESNGGNPIQNIENWKNHTSEVKFVFNMGGALGDTTWMGGTEVPMVSLHVTNDPFAPYGSAPCECSCPVIVPTTGQFVVNVAGSRCLMRMVDEKFKLNGSLHYYSDNANDVYTMRANEVNEGHEGLFPFEMIDPGILIPGDPFHGQAGPWEWWDYADLQTLGAAYGLTTGEVDTIYQGGLLTNPDMSKAKGLAYIDTVQGYLAPRMVQALILPGFVGVNDLPVFNNTVKMFPNPAESFFTLQLDDPSLQMQTIRLYDITGRLIKEISGINSYEIKISRNELAEGLYMVKISLKDREIQGKLLFQ